MDEAGGPVTVRCVLCGRGWRGLFGPPHGRPGPALVSWRADLPVR
jgi:hypothetical protein